VRTGLAFIAVVLGSFWIAGPTSADTLDIGQVATPGYTGGCMSCTALQQTTGTGPSGTVPPGTWAVTSWSIRSGTTMDGFDQLEIWRPDGTNFRLVAQSDFESVVHVATTGAVRTFPADIPVQPGDVLGLRTGDMPGDVAYDWGPADLGAIDWEVFPGDPSVGQTVGPTGDITTYSAISESRVNVAATLTGSAPTVPPTQPPVQPKKKCKKHKKHKKRAVSSKKKCKKKGR
jgi:hypothetical protein